MKNIIMSLFFVAIFLVTGCTAQKSTAAEEKRPQQGDRRQPPSIDEIFKMDTNKDGKLSKEEVKGPLSRDFSKVDSDGDGFITRTELENAPKPERDQRPPRQ